MSPISSSLLLAALPYLVSCSPIRIIPRSISSDATQVVNRTFDYVIAGGGLTGLTVASRLTENPDIRVLVIEGGADNHEDPRIADVRTYGEAFETELDYNLTSSPISWRDGYQLPMVAGKTLGGSGSINGASWTKGSAKQYNLLPVITGDDSWGWDDFHTHMLHAENFTAPSAELMEKGANFTQSVHGEGGPVSVSFAQGMFGIIQKPALEASMKVWSGLQKLADVASGVVNGATTIPNMLQADINQARSGPYQAFILGQNAQNRSNLEILTGHRVIRIVWDQSEDGKLTASGVSFQASRDSEPLFVNASREVLLAAGSMQSPQILELSGVGDESILSAAGVPLVKSLPGVGKNLQEQTKTTLAFTPNTTAFDGSGPNSAISFPNIHQLLGTNASSIFSHLHADLPAYASALESAGNVVNATATLNILTHQLNNLYNDSDAAVEIFFTLDAASGLVGTDLWNLIVLARGSIHIASNNSWDHPRIDPNYFGSALDLRLQTTAAMQAREVFETAPLAEWIVGEVTPGYDAVARNASYADWEAWVKQSFTSVWHPIATLSMMKEEFGGVVDSQLKVYGVQGLRVVDASVLPVQLSAHLSSSLYGIAEKAAAMIKADQ